eukprot:1156748-Pelagomonas_calceolata.AAC.11
MPKDRGPEWDSVAVPDAEPEAEGERAHACTYAKEQQLTTKNATDIVQPFATCACSRTCSWGRLGFGWMQMREVEEKMGQLAARGGVHGGSMGLQALRTMQNRI